MRLFKYILPMALVAWVSAVLTVAVHEERRLAREGTGFAIRVPFDCDGDSCWQVPREGGGLRWRFIGFDAPEIFYAKCDSERALGEAAREHTLGYIRRGGEMVITGHRGHYGRLLVEAPRLKAELIERGLARKGARRGWCGQ